MSENQRDNVHQLHPFDPESLFQSLHDLRQSVIRAWRERAVLLTKEEQERLRQEIRETCELLTALTK